MNAISLDDPTGEPWLTVSDFLKVGIISSFFALCLFSVCDSFGTVANKAHLALQEITGTLRLIPV